MLLGKVWHDLSKVGHLCWSMFLKSFIWFGLVLVQGGLSRIFSLFLSPTRPNTNNKLVSSP